MNNWIKASGSIQIDNGVRILTNVDICRYYQWHIKKNSYNTIRHLNTPAHGGHISIVLPKIHKITDYSKVRYLARKVVEFEYNPEDIYESKVNFWVPVRCAIEKEIKDALGIVDSAGYYGLHLTVGNIKGLR